MVNFRRLGNLYDIYTFKAEDWIIIIVTVNIFLIILIIIIKISIVIIIIIIIINHSFDL